MDYRNIVGKKDTILLASAIIIITFAALFSLILDYGELNEEFTTNATIVDTNESDENFTLGIDADRDLHFGRVSRTTNVTKTIKLSSEEKSIAQLDSSGNISEYLKHDESRIFEGDEDVEVTMVGEEEGYFEGNIVLSVKVPDNKVSELWLRFKEFF